MRLGMQVVVEDYIAENSTKVVLLILNTFICVTLFAAAADAALKIAIRLILKRLIPPFRLQGTSHMTAAYTWNDHTYDVVVVGAGGAGLRADARRGRAGLQAPPASPRCSRPASHTVAAQGGIAAVARQHGPGRLALAHVRHRRRVRTGWATRTRSNIMAAKRRRRSTSSSIAACRSRAPKKARSTSARSAAMTTNFGEGPGPAHLRRRRPHRPRHAAHALRPGLRNTAEFFIEYFALDLIMETRAHCRGVIAWKLDDGTIHRFRAKMVVLATGGYGRAYFSATSAHTCTGDGGGMVLRAGLPLQDMEFVQFHPTGIYGAGCLITEGARGEGGYLTNSRGRALHGALCARPPRTWPRATWSPRSMTHGDPRRPRRRQDKDHIYLHLDHLDPKVLHERLPGISEMRQDLRRRRRDQASRSRSCRPCTTTWAASRRTIIGEVLTEDDGDPDKPWCRA